MATADPDRYDIYTLRRVLSLHAPAPSAPPGAAASRPPAPAPSPPAAPRVRFEAVASARSGAGGAGSSFAFLALYCSNQSLLLRYTASTLRSRAIVRYLPWFKDDAKRVVSLAFSGDARRLLCLCADGSLFVVAALSLVLRDGLATPHAVENHGKHLASYAATPDNLSAAATAAAAADTAAAATATASAATTGAAASTARLGPGPARRGSTSEAAAAAAAIASEASSRSVVRVVDLSRLSAEGVQLQFGTEPPAGGNRATQGATQGTGRACCCAWWARSDNGRQYVLLGTTTGKLVVLTLSVEDFATGFVSAIGTGVVANVAVCTSPIASVEVVQNAERCWSFALITSTSTNTYRVPLAFRDGQRGGGGKVVSIETTALWQNDLDIADIAGVRQDSADNHFLPERVACSTAARGSTRTAVHSLGAKGDGVGVFDRRAAKLQILSPDAPLPFQYPLFEYQTGQPVASGRSSRRDEAPVVLLRDRVLFTVSADRGGGHTNALGLSVHVLSAMVAARLCGRQRPGLEPPVEQARMQRFRTPAGWSTRVVDVLPAPWLFALPAVGEAAYATDGGDNGVSSSGVSAAGMPASGAAGGGGGDASSTAENGGAPVLGLRGASGMGVEGVTLEGIVIVTEDALYECAPRSALELEEEFFRLVTTGLQGRQGEMLAQSLGLNVLDMYEQAADRVLRTGGQAALALDLYLLSNATSTKITRELVLAHKPLLAASYARQCLSKLDPSRDARDMQSLAHRIIRCYLSSSGSSGSSGSSSGGSGGGGSAGSSDAAVAGAASVKDGGNGAARSSSSSPSAFFIPSGRSRAADPHAHPSLLHFLETSSSYDLEAIMHLLLEHSLVGSALVAAHSRGQVPRAIVLLLDPSAPRIGTSELDFLVASGHTADVCHVGRGGLLRALPLPLQIRFVCHLARHQTHLIVDLMPMVLGILPRMPSNQLQELHEAIEVGSPVVAAALSPLAAFKVGELNATVLLYLASGGDNASRTRLLALLKDPHALPVRTDIVAARCADFRCWDAAAAAFEAHQDWVQVLRCRIAHAGGSSGTTDEQLLDVVGEVLTAAGRSAVPSKVVRLMEYLLRDWVSNGRKSAALEAFFMPKLATMGSDLASAVFDLPAQLRASLGLSAEFSLALVKIELNQHVQHGGDDGGGSSGGRGRTESTNMWAEIRGNLAGMNTQKNRSVELNAEVLLSCREPGRASAKVVVFTCGHAFAEDHFRAHVLPRFQKQLAQRLDAALPSTLAAIVREYNGTTMALPCPKCLFRVMVREADALKSEWVSK